MEITQVIEDFAKATHKKAFVRRSRPMWDRVAGYKAIVVAGTRPWIPDRQETVARIEHVPPSVKPVPQFLWQIAYFPRWENAKQEMIGVEHVVFGRARGRQPSYRNLVSPQRAGNLDS